jgi:hypothetical protein
MWKLRDYNCAIFTFFKPPFLALAIAFFLSGCVPYKIPTTAYYKESYNPYANHQKMEALNHWLYEVVPRHRSQIYWYDAGHWLTWALFGNDENGIFGEDQRKDGCYLPMLEIGLKKALRWSLRNPLHNFCFYVIGSAHRTNSEFTILSVNPSEIKSFDYQPCGRTVFSSRNGGFYLGLHGGKPFVSLRIFYTSRHGGEFYLGWRERGNFGIKFSPWVTIWKEN